MIITKWESLIGLTIKTITEIDDSPIFDEVGNESVKLHFTNGDIAVLESYGDYDGDGVIFLKEWLP